MPEFIYKAKRGPTEVVDGRVEAGSLDDAVDKLDRMGLLPIHLDEVTAETKKTRKAAPDVKAPRVPKTPGIRLFSGVRSTEITMFGRQLASLIKSGVPILRALWIIGEQTQNPRFRQFLDTAQKDINNGKTLSHVLADHPKLFPVIYVAMVRTGEDSGNLQEAMMRISDYRQRQEEILSRIRTAMAYPALMALTGIGTIVFMLTYVIPKLTNLFSSLGSHLPLPTRILMKISSLFQSPWFWSAAAALIAVTVLVFKLRSEQMKLLWSSFSLRLPVIKSFVIKTELARFSRTFELLIKS